MNTLMGQQQVSELPTESVRLDKWLWAVRLYKTRSDAAEACRGSAVRLNEQIAKPSAKVRIGDTVVARTKAITRTLYVVGLTEKRVGAGCLSTWRTVLRRKPSMRPSKNAPMLASSNTKVAGAQPRKTAAISNVCSIQTGNPIGKGSAAPSSVRIRLIQSRCRSQLPADQ